jgi:WD40 repeat protein
VRDLSFSPDGHTLATASSGGAAVLWNSSSGNRISTIAAANGAAEAVAFSPGGSLLAIGYGNGVVRLWRPAAEAWSGGPLAASRKPITSVGFSDDGSLLFAGSEDGKAYLWDVAKQQALGAGLPKAAGGTMARGLSNERLVTVSEDGTVHVWPLRVDRWKARACQVADRRLTRQEWRELLPNRAFEPSCG